MTDAADLTTAARVARNEDAVRRVNERIIDTANELDANLRLLPFICECPERDCTNVVRLTVEEYEEARSSGRTFLVAPGHEPTVVDGVTVARLVKTLGRFSLMEKIGETGEVAEQLDPRTDA
jgi:hypothetical protein